MRSCIKLFYPLKCLLLLVMFIDVIIQLKSLSIFVESSSKLFAPLKIIYYFADILLCRFQVYIYLNKLVSFYIPLKLFQNTWKLFAFMEDTVDLQSSFLTCRYKIYSCFNGDIRQ